MNLALEIEGRAYNLYRRLSHSAEDSIALVALQEMMEQEVKQIKSLKKLREELAH